MARYKMESLKRHYLQDLALETPNGEPGRWTYDVFFVAK